MADTIKQLQASYNPAEDRILFKLRTDHHQFQAWITRRYMQLLIPALHGQHPTTGENLLNEKQQIISEMEKAKAAETLMSPEAQQPYQAPDSIEDPLGKEPILLVKLTFKDLHTHNPTIVFEPETGPGIALSFQPQIISALVQIFSQALNTSDWELNLNPILAVPENITLQ